MKTFFGNLGPRLVTALPLWLLVLQLAGVFSVLYAVSFYSIPGALALGGIIAVVAVQTQPDRAQVRRDAVMAEKARAFAAVVRTGQLAGKGDSVSVKAVVDSLTEG